MFSEGGNTSAAQKLFKSESGAGRQKASEWLVSQPISEATADCLE